MGRALDQPPADATDLAQLLHQVVLGVEAAGGVHQHDLGPARERRAQAVVDHRGRVRSGARAQQLDAGAPGPHLELLDRGGAEGVGGDQQRGPSGASEARGELAGERGLADPVHADQECHPRTAAIRLEARALGAQQVGRGLLQRAAQVERRIAAQEILGALDQGLGGGRADVGGEQRLLEAGPGGGVHGAHTHDRAERLLEALAGAAEAGADPLPEAHGPVSVPRTASGTGEPRFPGAAISRPRPPRAAASRCAPESPGGRRTGPRPASTLPAPPWSRRRAGSPTPSSSCCA